MLSIIFFLFDRVLKLLIINIPDSGIFLIPKILSLEFYKNYGAAFGLKIPIFLIVAFSIIIISVILFLAKKKRKKTPEWVFLFLILGSLSNIFDRIYYGYVIDTFNFLNFSFFNIADGMI
ncbi:MAG: signal peptidase II, partial [Parcubacteria group bacterium]|nr:signal peptidase II [Parcubacteria group bacterium]